MAIEGLDAGLPVEVAAFVPQVGLSPEAEAGPTLDAALAAAAQRAEAPGAGAEDATARELAAPDLWVSARPGYRPEIQLAQLDPVAGAFAGSPVVDAEADAAAPDPLLLHKLTIDDLRTSGTGRYGDSTEDYAWNEMSTGSWDWVVLNLADQAQNDIRDIVATSSSREEAAERVRIYLAQNGFSDSVQIYNPASVGPDGAIVVNAPPPPPPPPLLLLHYDNPDAWGDAGSGNPGGGGAGSPLPLNTDPIADNNPDGPDVGIEVLYEENWANVVAAAAALMAKIEVLDAKFNALSNTDTIMMKNGMVVTGAELKAWWNDFDFRVTDRSFPTGAGAVYNGVSNIRWDAVFGYNAWGPNGLAFIILHEFTHGSPIGRMADGVMFAFHEMFGGTASTYNQNNFWFDSNEEFANWGAREIMIGLGIPAPLGTPPFGYNDTMPASPLWAPPPPPSFPGGGGGGGGDGGGSGGGGSGGGSVTE